MLCLLDGDDIGKALGSERFNEVDTGPGFIEHVGIVELESVEIELNHAPGVGVEKIRKIISELLGREVRDVMLELGANPADSAGVSLNGFGLYSLELEVLPMGVVVALEFSFD